MKTKNSFLLILCLLLFSSLHAQNEPVKILAIGNSFADDGIEYLDEIAISAGKHIIVANTYIGGCSIQRHLDNARHDKHDYKYRKNIDGKYTEEKRKSLLEALKDEEWDYIVFQQASSFAGQYSSYFPELTELMEYVKANFHRKISLDDVARTVYLSRSYLSSIFKEETGQSLFSYINKVRVEKSKLYLRDSGVALVDVAALCGFEDQSYFTKVFKKETGMSPKKYRDRK